MDLTMTKLLIKMPDNVCIVNETHSYLLITNGHTFQVDIMVYGGKKPTNFQLKKTYQMIEIF